MKSFYSLIFCILFCFQFSKAQEVGTTYEPVVSQNAYFDVSQPLYELGPIAPRGASGHHLHKNDPSIPKLNHETVYLNPDNALPKGEDPSWQRDMGGKGISPPFVNFEGIRNSDNGAGGSVAPPDTDGDVGPNHYFHMCNTIFEIFDKNGTSLFGPADNSTIWDGFIGDWTGTNDGDPITLYDEYADRWLVSQFAVNTSITGGTYWVLVAISTGPNPTGSYYRYAFQFTDYPDYPKFGVWRDGYYLMVQHGNGTATAAALNRSQMIAGNATAQMVSYAIPSLPGSGFSSVLPADNDGTLAPSGSPNYFVYFSDDAWGSDPVDRLKIWELKVNWTFPWLSTMTFKLNLNTTAFDSSFGTHNQGIIPQPGTTQKLAVLEKALMNRLQYRNFGSYQSMVCCHTVDVNGSNRAGVRWYELRKTTGDWYIYQQGTYAPGTTDNYWMASIAQNGTGDIALGFSVSSSSTYPSVRYTGRKLGDPLGQMTMAEQTIINGSFSQGGTARWGDYSRMSVDPSDDETFWYTNEYIGNYQAWGAWITRVGAFSIDSYCDASGGCDEYIANVQIGTINNSSGCSGYANYTAISTDLPLNATHLLTVTNGQPYASDQCGVWIDWNRDEDFNDANETITVTGTPGVGPYTANITPPASATLGPVRMRVRITYTGSVSSCGTTTYGEVEDYTINLTPKVPNVWTGAFNSYWHNDQNWSLGHIPTADEDVIITSAGYQPPKVDFYDEACNNLTIESGELVVKGYTLQVNGNLDIHGKLSMDNASGNLNVTGNVVWHEGSTAGITAAAIINVYGHWNFNAGANANLLSGFVDFRGTTDNWIRSYSNNSSFYNLRIYKTGGAKSKVSFLSTQDLVVNNLTFITSGAILESHSNYNIVMKGTFNYYGTFDFTMNSNTGSAVFSGNTQSINNYASGSGTFNNVRINSTTKTTIVSAEVIIAKNLTINSGQLDAGANTIKIGGNWTNNAFPTGFSAGTGRVIFNGAGHQYVYSSETFNILEANMGAALRISNAAATVTCNQYDWKAGGIDVIAGTFTALDLVQNGIFGGYWLNPGGVINITNNDGYVDLNGGLNIYGGTFNVFGGTTSSYWPYAANATINMSDGVLDFKDQGILIYNTGTYTLNDNITGGIIRTSGGFSGNRADFTPAAGTFEFYGSGDYSISQSNGCTLRNVVINKGAKEGGDNSTGESVYDERSGELLSDGGKANTITLGSNFVVTGNLTIEAGSFNMGAYTCNVSNTTTIYGHLIMTNAANDLTTVNMYWENGSSANVTAGTFHAGAWAFREGTTAKFGTGNTTYITSSMSFPTSNEAEFGNLVRGPLSKNVVEEDNSKAYYPVKVMGNLLIKSGASLFYLQPGADLIVAGNAVIEGGSSISFSAADFQVDGALDLSGTLAISNNRSAAVESELTFPASGWLYLSNGTFSCNYDVSTFSTNLGGKLTMNEGSLVEFPGRGITIGATFVNEITGGTMRFGRTLTANSAGNFMVDFGNVEFISSNTGHYIQVTNGNYVNNLIVNKPGGSLLVHDHLTIKGDLTINAGTFNSNNKTIQIAGDWLNNVGPAAFTETNSRVIFNGSTPQFSTTEDFYILEVNKPLQLLYNVSGHNITCQIYDWTNGGIWISPGNFTAYDLADDGLFGTFANFSGTMNLFQDASQYVDLNGELIIGAGGTINVWGGNGVSFWPYAANASLTISGDGILDFKDVGIYLYNSPTYTFTENVTGGTIRTTRSFEVSNPGFTPAGGTIQLSGGPDAYVNHISGTYFHNLLINKVGGDGSKGEPSTDRNGNVTENTKSNLIWATSNLVINNNLQVETGTFHSNGNALTVGGNVVVNSEGFLNLNSNSMLKMGPAKTITVNSGGKIGAFGTLGTEPKITRASSGFYIFNIESGGTIAAEYAIFEYMGMNGVNLNSGALVDPAFAFNYCTFRNGAAGETLLSIQNDQELICTGANFPANTWGGVYNVSKWVNHGRITFEDFTGDFAGSAYELDPFSRVDWYEPQLSVSPSILIATPPAGSMTFDITSNLDWTISESIPWVEVAPMSGSNNATITVNYTQNSSPTPRSGIITISAPDVPDVIVTINQAGANLSVTPASQSVSASMGSTSFNVASNTSWTVSESVLWLSVLPMSGAGNNTLVVNYNQNSSVTPRSGQITVSSPGLPNVVVTVNQAGAGATLTVTPANRDVGATAGSTTFNLTSNTGWNVSESVPWLSVTPLSGTGNGTLTVNYGENATGSTRIGNINVTATGGSPSVNVTVTQVSYPTHSVSLNAGWQGLSSYIMPVNNAIEDVFAPVLPDFIIAQTMTGMYYPAGPVNTIGDWLSQSAYKLKMSNAATLPIIGNGEINKVYSLASGWNLVPVIVNSPVNPVTLFGGSSLTIAKDVAGVGVYWPAYGINTLGNLLPGKAYYALMGSSGSVTFPPNAKDAWTGNYPNFKFPAHPWNELSISPSSHLIAIEAEGLNRLQPGDVLGVFSPQGICFGVTEISDISQNALITAYADDPFTGNKDGFDESELMSYRLFRPQTGEEFDVEVEYNLQLPQTGHFSGEGLSAIKMLNLSATGTTENLTTGISIYPNPTDGTIWVAGISNFDKIELIGSLGSVINAVSTDGQSNISIDLSTFQPGVYQLRFSGERGTVVKRVVKN